jgi:peptidoglycan/LPS O-acetylase OafA/YrhL
MRASGAGEGNSFADRIRAAGGHTRGFDYLRLMLAVSVVAFHSFTTTHDLAADHDLWRSPMRALLRLFLPMFFALSGFLVAGSLFRSASLIEFALLRLLRIVPALLAEITLSAVILGPLLSEFPLRRYLTDRQFFSYFLNVVGDVHFSLPGMFLHNPRPRIVNGSLWTIPFEGLCYAALAALALSGVIRHRAVFAGAVVAIMVALTCWLIATGAVVWAPPGQLLVVAFLAGIVLYLYRDVVPCDARLFLLACAATLYFLHSDKLVSLAVVPLAYATVFLGVINPKKTILLRGDYSYGLYLFAYPIQQGCVMLFPSLRNTLGCFLVALPLSFAYAIFSWHCVENPILRKKKAVIALLWRKDSPETRFAGRLNERASSDLPRT